MVAVSAIRSGKLDRLVDQHDGDAVADRVQAATVLSDEGSLHRRDVPTGHRPRLRPQLLQKSIHLTTLREAKRLLRLGADEDLQEFCVEHRTNVVRLWYFHRLDD